MYNVIVQVIIDEPKAPSAPRHGGSDSSGFGSGKGEPTKVLYFDANISSHVVNAKVSDVIRYPSLGNELEKQRYPDKAKNYPDKGTLPR